jgi:hypothetical protein
MFAAQQRVKEAHVAFPPALKMRAGLLISYFNASSKAFVPQRKIQFDIPQLVAKLTRLQGLIRHCGPDFGKHSADPFRLRRKASLPRKIGAFGPFYNANLQRGVS